MTCNHCGKPGHKYADCWQWEENKNKRPQNYKTSLGKQAQASMDKGNKIKYLLCGMMFPTDQKMLTDPNVWIANTAATVHTTPHASGMTEEKDATKEVSIRVGNDDKEPASKIASIVGMMCTKHGNELHLTKMTEVTHLPSGKLNLFSLTRLEKQGWLLNGDKDKI